MRRMRVPSDAHRQLASGEAAEATRRLETRLWAHEAQPTQPSSATMAGSDLLRQAEERRVLEAEDGYHQCAVQKVVAHFAGGFRD